MGLPISLASVIRAFDVRDAEERFHVLPATVLTYDPAKMEVNVQIAVKNARRSEDGSPVYTDFPAITEVKVGFPRAGGMIISMPLQPGDTGFLLFTTLDAQQWEMTGQVGSEPSNLIRNGQSSCVFLPNWWSDVDPPDPTDTTARTTKLVIGNDGGMNITISPTEIAIGGTSLSPATDKVAQASQVRDALHNLFNGWTPVPNDGGAALKTRWLSQESTFTAAIGASKVKAK